MVSTVPLNFRIGQRLHSMHMVILPLIPIFILIIQNGIRYGTYVFQAYEMERVIGQVNKSFG